MPKSSSTVAPETRRDSAFTYSRQAWDDLEEGARMDQLNDLATKIKDGVDEAMPHLESVTLYFTASEAEQLEDLAENYLATLTSAADE